MKSFILGAVVLLCCALAGTGFGTAAMLSSSVASHSAASVAPVRNGAVMTLVREGAAAAPVVPKGAVTMVVRELAGNPGTFVATPCHPWSCAS